MPNTSPDLKFKVTSAIMDTNKLISEENFYAQGQQTPAQITRKLTYMLGTSPNLKNDFPLATKLLGGGYFNTSQMQRGDDGTMDNPFHINSNIKTIATTEFTYPIMGNFRNGAEIATTVTGATNGIAGQTFKVLFRTNALHKSFIIQSPRKIQLYVEDVRPVGSLYEYTLKIANGNMNQYCPVGELVSGTVWINMFSAIAESGSRNIDIARMITPALYKNQITKMRVGLSWEGESATKECKFYVFNDVKSNGELELDSNNKPKSLWIDQYTYNFEVDNLTMVESMLWYSEYNRNANGTIPLKDNITNKTIAIGAGLLSQITNKIVYNRFSHKFLADVISRGLYGIKGLSKEKTLYTGTLGYRFFDKAMKEAGIAFYGASGFGGGNVADKFLSGTNMDLMLGGYFEGFYHVDGWIIKVKKVSIFDNSLVSNSPIDEESGLPWESARMVLIDDGVYDGENNIQLIMGEGFSPYKHAVLRGFNDVPPSIRLLQGSTNLSDKSQIDVVGSDEEKSSYMRMYKMGIQMMKGNTSFDLQYIPY
jgi:hypothetical protein